MRYAVFILNVIFGGILAGSDCSYSLAPAFELFIPVKK